MSTKRIGMTVGEPRGVGPELIVNTLTGNPPPADVQYIVYGSPRLLHSVAQRLGRTLPDTINIRSCGPDLEEESFNTPELRARASMEAINTAADAAEMGSLHALLTAPVDKAIACIRHPGFTGHTTYLAARAHAQPPVMLLDNGEIRVALLTEHLPLREVPHALSQEQIKAKVSTLISGLAQWFGLEKPRLAMASLNPHVGELVQRSEEETVLRPAVEELRQKEIQIEGPLAADSLFPLARQGRWDAVISPYHDQGLVAVKYPGVDKVVNITLGLPYFRLSPGHGVAYSVVGTGKLDPRSWQRALDMAMQRNWAP